MKTIPIYFEHPVVFRAALETKGSSCIQLSPMWRLYPDEQFRSLSAHQQQKFCISELTVSSLFPQGKIPLLVDVEISEACKTILHTDPITGSSRVDLCYSKEKITLQPLSCSSIISGHRITYGKFLGYFHWKQRDLKSLEFQRKDDKGCIKPAEIVFMRMAANNGRDVDKWFGPYIYTSRNEFLSLIPFLNIILEIENKSDIPQAFECALNNVTLPPSCRLLSTVNRCMVWDENGYPLLHSLCKTGSVDDLHSFFSEFPCVDIDYQDSDGWTPLLIACAHNSASVVEYLLKHSANTKIVAFSGESIQDVALIRNDSNIISLLRDYRLLHYEIIVLPPPPPPTHPPTIKRPSTPRYSERNVLHNHRTHVLRCYKTFVGKQFAIDRAYEHNCCISVTLQEGGRCACDIPRWKIEAFSQQFAAEDPHWFIDIQIAGHRYTWHCAISELLPRLIETFQNRIADRKFPLYFDPYNGLAYTTPRGLYDIGATFIRENHDGTE
ncbi:MAG: ankyrin repeat domain-containing protein [Akkermansia sp.]|nr:ankyrin repeat domain-containing protein [Akkermansia sp.]